MQNHEANIAPSSLSMKRQVVGRAVLWLSVLLLLLSAASLSAQSCLRWVQRTDVGSPGQRYGHSMAYDAARGVTILFGGQFSEVGEDPEFFQDIWEYDGVR